MTYTGWPTRRNRTGDCAAKETHRLHTPSNRMTGRLSVANQSTDCDVDGSAVLPGAAAAGGGADSARCPLLAALLLHAACELEAVPWWASCCTVAGACHTSDNIRVCSSCVGCRCDVPVCPRSRPGTCAPQSLVVARLASHVQGAGECWRCLSCNTPSACLSHTVIEACRTSARFVVLLPLVVIECVALDLRDCMV